MSLINSLKNNGNTVLHCAIIGDNLDVVENLISNGADKETKKKVL